MLFKDLNCGDYFKNPYDISNWIWMKVQPDEEENNNCVIVYPPDIGYELDWYITDAEVEKVNAKLVIEGSDMNVVEFKDLQVGEYFRSPDAEIPESKDWVWLKIKENHGDIDSGGWYNTLVIVGQGADHDFSYEADYCPNSMKVIKVNRPKSFK